MYCFFSYFVFLHQTMENPKKLVLLPSLILSKTRHIIISNFESNIWVSLKLWLQLIKNPKVVKIQPNSSMDLIFIFDPPKGLGLVEIDLVGVSFDFFVLDLIESNQTKPNPTHTPITTTLRHNQQNKSNSLK